MKALAFYLAGSIQKGHETNELCWKQEHMEELRKHLAPCQLSFLNPAFRSDDLSDQKSVFGRDMVQVFCADIVLVDARGRRGLGVGAEMMWAKLHNIPVITWAPRDTHYNKGETSILGVEVKNFIHPFVEGLSDKIVSSLEEAALFIQNELASLVPKGIVDIQETMRYFLSKGLDAPMQEVFTQATHLQDKLDSFTTKSMT